MKESPSLELGSRLAEAVLEFCMADEEFYESTPGTQSEEYVPTDKLGLSPLSSGRVRMQIEKNSLDETYFYVDFPTIMHAFQAHKYPETEWKNFQTISLLDANNLGRKAVIDVSKWDAEKYDLMKSIYKGYLEQHTTIKDDLISTGDKHIFEVAVPGTYWSTANYETDSTGDNHIGRICMELRAAFEKKNGKRKLVSTDI